MQDVLKLLVDLLAAKLTPRARPEAEIIVLRHQLNVLRRAAPKRPKLTNLDRLLFVWLYRRVPEVLRAVTVVRPETVVRWHRGGFRLYRRWKSRWHDGRPRMSADIRRLIREMRLANPLWGAPPTHSSLGKGAPVNRPIQRVGKISALPILGGFHH
jgi:hypothetical protein